MNSYLILTEVGKKIGFGHFTRCSAIAKALHENNIAVRMMVYANEISWNDSFSESINWLERVDTLQSLSNEESVIIDSYLAESSHYTKLKAKFNKIIVIDDYNRINYPAHLIINPNVSFDNSYYSNQNAKSIGGKDYVILRPEFRIPYKKEIKQSCESVLVSLGGTDYRNLLSPLLKLASNFEDLKWTFINPEEKSLADIPSNSTIIAAVNASEMADLIKKSDIVISACGQTLHELVALQTPTIGICIDIDQNPNQGFYLHSGFLMDDNKWDDTSLISNLEVQINKLKPVNQRKKLSAICEDLINKDGVYNIVSYIQSI